MATNIQVPILLAMGGGAPAGPVNADTLMGYEASAFADINTVALRDADGSIYANYFYGSGVNLTNVVTSVQGQQGAVSLYATDIGALDPYSDGSNLTGITPGQVGAVSNDLNSIYTDGVGNITVNGLYVTGAGVTYFQGEIQTPGGISTDLLWADSAKGPVLSSRPTGIPYRIIVDDDGILGTEAA